MRKNKSFFNNVFFVGLLSFFGGISQDIILPILPLYLANVLNFDKSFIGLTEGLVTSGASIFKLFAGILSDKLKLRKSIVFAGYFLSFVSRPLLAIFTSFWAISILRFSDGVGKGIKESPKDALIADSTLPQNRGKGFGIARMLDTFGSVVGPLLLFALLYLLQNNNFKYHYIFFIAAIPLIFTLLILVIFVKETPFKTTNYEQRTNKLTNNKGLPFKFYMFLLIISVFALGNSSDAFLILRAQNLGVGLLSIPLIYALFNFIYASFSVPLGGLSDKIGREKVIILGWFAYALSYLGFALASNSIHVWILFAFYGIYYATTTGVSKAFVADLITPENRGTAYGIYNTAIGLITLPASVIAGILWDKFNPSAPFLFGSAVAGFSTILMLIFIKSHRIKTA